MVVTFGKETQTPKDFETSSDFYFSITQAESEIEEIAKKVKDIYINNEQLETYIKLIKKDKKTGKVVTASSATFQIKATEDIYDRGNNKIIYKKGEIITQKIGSTTYSTFTTNADNLVIPAESYNSENDEKGTVVTPLKLEVGSYELLELQEPEGFLIAENSIKFKVEGIRDYDKDQDGDYILTIEVYNEQPTGTLIIDKSIALREYADTSLVNISDLSKIQFKLTAKEDMIDKADNSVIYSAGEEIGIYNLSKEGKIEISNIPMGYVLLQEIQTLDGLLLNDEVYEIEFKQENNTTKVYTKTLEIENETTIVEISKTDITGEKEIVGATLRVLDKDNNVIDKWVSTEKSHIIEGLIVGQEYILEEEISAKGYVKATSIKFIVNNTTEIQKVTMIDKIVEMSKIDIAGDELEGATIVVTNKRTKNIVDKWISEKEPHIIQGLIEGETYIMHEEIAIEGYVKATDIEFIVTLDKETQHIEMIDKIVLISKTDLVTGEELPGAELIVTDKDGNEVDKWISTDEPHQVIGLKEGEEYTLTEITCPYGFEQAESITFKVTTDKETQKIEMKDMPILKTLKIFKVDEDTEEIIKDKFTFAIYEDEECTRLIQMVDSDKKQGTVTFEGVRYGTVYLKELSAPKGYQLSDKIVKIEINDNGVFADGELLEDDNSICTFTYYNKQIPKIQTGNEINYILLIASIVISLLGITSGIIILKRNKKNN